MVDQLNIAKQRPYDHSYLADNKIIFIHIPKVAGHGLLSSLGIKTPGHIHLVAYELEDIEKYASSYKIGFVRNPWDRLVSAYFYLMKRGPNEKYHEIMQRLIGHLYTFKLFTQEFSNNSQFRNAMLRSVYFKPQYSWITNSIGQIELDYIGRYEKLDEGFELLKEKLNKPDASLKVLNKSEHLPYWEYYTEELVECVRGIYKTDTEVFQYEFPYEKL